MGSLAIVAIPSEDDYVNKLSSEKVPHMTLLFLGEDVRKIRNLSKILDFVGHAADQSLLRFGMEVDHRGVLGPDLADVVFFSKSKWSGFETVNDYRSYLLKDDNIRTAYDSTTQFPEWIPHLTLGYPATPAKPDERDYPGINHVIFDRIAVWFGDFEGIEFPLKAYNSDQDVAMGHNTERVVHNILEHHGVLGMKWGHRGRSSSGPQTHSQVRAARRKAKQTARRKETAKRIAIGVGVTASLAAAGYLSYKFASSGYRPRSIKTTTSVGKSFVEKLAEESWMSKSIPSSGPRTFASRISSVQGYKPFDQIAVERAARAGIKITDLDFPNIKHHGVKGMHWGVRSANRVGDVVVSRGLGISTTGNRKRSAERVAAGPQKVKVSSKGKKLKTSGGKGFPAHADAVRARSVGQIGKKSGLKSLSNQELEEFTKRLRLEQTAKQLAFQDKNAGQKFIAKLLGQTGSNQAHAVANEVASQQVKKHVFAKLAVAAA